MTVPGYLGGPVPCGGRGWRQFSDDAPTDWWAEPAALDHAAVMALHADGLTTAGIAIRLKVPLVLVAEHYLLRGMRPHPARVQELGTVPGRESMREDSARRRAGAGT